LLYWFIFGNPPFFYPTDDQKLFRMVQKGTWYIEAKVKSNKLCVAEETIMLIQACLRN
jgi:hypothetical protein